MDELARLAPLGFKQANKWPVTLVLDNVRSLHNVGSVFRTADAFRVERLFLCGITGTPPHKELHKTALGATETVNWQHFADTQQAFDLLSSEGYKIYCIEQTKDSIPLQSIVPAFPLALVFGNEVDGVSQSIINQADSCIEIPQFGSKHSFNIAVSAGIVLWDLWVKCKDTTLIG